MIGLGFIYKSNSLLLQVLEKFIKILQQLSMCLPYYVTVS